MVTAMGDTDRCSRHGLHKHVTIACDACRRKRCKCNGQMPCLPCSSARDLCVYSHNDRRRQRHKRTTIRQSTNQRTTVQSPVGNAVVGTRNDGIRSDETTHMNTGAITREQKNEGQKNLDLGTNSNRAEPEEAATQETNASHRAAMTSARDRQIRTILPFTDGRDHSARCSTPKVYIQQDMQGKFGTKPDQSSRSLGSGRLLLPNSEPLVRPASTSQAYHDARSRHHKNSRPVDQQRQGQSMWQLGRQRYAMPGYTRTFGNLPFSSSIKANGYPADVQVRQALNFSVPPHLIFPLIAVDDSSLGRALTDFWRLSKRSIAEGTAPSQVADQGLTDVTLFFRNRLPGDPMNASAWTAEMLRTFRGTFSDELLLACAVCVRRLMCWFIVPTAENYANMPSMIRPTDLQRVKPHPSWVDLMMFPTFRNALVNTSRDWVKACTKARWEFLWPHTLEEALVRHTSTQQIFLTPEFAAYADDPKHWLMQRSILEDFPEAEASEINISQD